MTADAIRRESALTAVAASMGARLVAARLVRIEASGGGFVTGHEVDLLDDRGARTETVYVDSGDHADAPVLRLEGEAGEPLSAWVYPNDPELPALPAAVFPDAAAALLHRLGFDATGLHLDVLSYRPCKRAVVRMTTATGILYLKVVHPAAAEPLYRRHTEWFGAGIPVPRALTRSPDGLVALEPLPGVDAITTLETLDAAFLDALDVLTAGIAAIPGETPARPSLASRVDWYERRVRAIAPEHAESIHAVAVRIGESLRAAGQVATPVTIHGDLHLGQVFIDPRRPDRIVGLLDIDTAGRGDPADDAAAMWAHLVVTAHQRGEHGSAAVRLARLVRERWTRSDDPAFAVRAAAIAAVHLLGHALSGALPAPVALELAATSVGQGKPLASD